MVNGSPFGHRATEYATGVAIAFSDFKALLAEEFEHLQEIGALLHHVNSARAVGELAQATRVGGEGDDLHQNRQALLGHRGRRRAFGQESADRLVLAVEGSADVHQAFMDFQGAHVAIVEHRIGADLDVVGPRRCIRNDAVGLEHANGFFRLAEHLVQAGLQQGDGVLGGEGLGSRP